jgi:formylglycine-generating enzyme required for sulfatase activity/mono/diheme cytochrome c family protein
MKQIKVRNNKSTFFMGGLFAALSVAMIGQATAADAKFESYTEKIPGSSVSFDMVAIPGGEITVGSPENEAGRDKNELAAKKVTVKPFYMGKYEVSWQEYILYVFGEKEEIEKEKKDGITRPTKPYGSVYRDRGEKGFPAIGMSQHSAVNFAKWLSWKTGKQYRLPTEAEWEFACRAGAETPYFWGDDKAKAGDYGWSKENSEGQTHPIGKKQPNKLGLYDIVGNVSEWCANADTNKPAVTRGGAFTEPVEKMRSASRMLDCPEWNELDPQSPPSIWWLSAADFVGIRLVCDADAPKADAKPAAAADAAAAAAPAAGDSAALLANFKKYCANCHGADGKGQTKIGIRVGARDYTDAKVKATLKDEEMFKALKEGLTIDGKEKMLPFKEKLTDEEITALVKHMKAF